MTISRKKHPARRQRAVPFNAANTPCAARYPIKHNIHGLLCTHNNVS